jgi:hypothetical protein
VAPDGSKEGWDNSNTGDEQRAELVAWLESQRYDDGSTSLDYAEVQFGDDDNDARILRCGDWAIPARAAGDPQ